MVERQGAARHELLVFLGHGRLLDGLPARPLESDRPPPHDVDNPLQNILKPHGNLNRRAVALQLVPNHPDHSPRVCADAVEFVDESDARNVVAAHLPIDCDGLALDAADAGEQGGKRGGEKRTERGGNCL